MMAELITPDQRWYYKNREKKLAWAKEYYLKNKPTISAKKAVHRATHRKQDCDYSRRWYQNNKQRYNQYRRSAHYKAICKAWRAKRSDRCLDSKLRHFYGMSLKDFEIMRDRQNGVCAICRRPSTRKNKWGSVDRLSVDHCSKTGKVRGLLCHECNLGLGLFKHDKKMLIRAAHYLR